MPGPSAVFAAGIEVTCFCDDLQALGPTLQGFSMDLWARSCGLGSLGMQALNVVEEEEPETLEASLY